MDETKRQINYVIAALKKIRELQVTKDARNHMTDLIERLESARISHDDAIAEAKMIGVRNPSFEGDMIGWLDDDFDWDELDEERKKRKKK